MPADTPEPLRDYLSGKSSLDEAVRAMRQLVGGFQFSATAFTPQELIKVMEFMKALDESPRS